MTQESSPSELIPVMETKQVAPEKKPVSPLNTVLWVISFFLALPLLTSETTVLSFALFMVALLITPPMTRLIERKSGWILPYGLRVALGVSLLIASIIYPQKKNESIANLVNDSPKPETSKDFAASLASHPATEQKPDANTQPAVSANEWKDDGEIEDNRHFPFGVEEYISWMNKNLSQTELPSVGSLSKSNTADGFLHQGMINERLGVLISERRDGKVDSIMFLGQGDGSMQSGADVMLAVISAVRAANQTASKENRLGKLALDLIKAEKEIVTYKGIEYRPTRSEHIGFMLTIIPAKS